MNDELDIVGLIRTLRKTQFMSNAYLKEYQKFFINKFHLYHLSADDEINKDVNLKQKMENSLSCPGSEKEDSIRYTVSFLENMVSQIDH
jgi:hypothetical protein